MSMRVSCCGHVVSVRWAPRGEQESNLLVRGPFGDGLLGTVVAFPFTRVGVSVSPVSRLAFFQFRNRKKENQR